MFAILGIGALMVALKLTKTLWVDTHNVWHGNFVGLMAWVMTGNAVIGIVCALISMVISLKLADWHAKRFQEFNEIGNITCIATAATIPATFAWACMKVIDHIPGLNKIDIKADDIKDRFGVFGETMTIGAILGLILSILAGQSFAQILTAAFTLGATLCLFPKMAAVMLEGMIPLSTSVTMIMKKKFKGRNLNITVDGAILLGHPAVMSTFVLMVPISVVLYFFIPGIHFIPIASLMALPYFIGAIVPYTRGNLVYTLIVTSLFLVMIGLIATAMAPVITEGLANTGFYTEEIAGGAQITCWDEGGNIFAWIIKLITDALK
jgi:PTS system galactitol-specific IIC component